MKSRVTELPSTWYATKNSLAACRQIDGRLFGQQLILSQITRNRGEAVPDEYGWAQDLPSTDVIKGFFLAEIVKDWSAVKCQPGKPCYGTCHLHPSINILTFLSAQMHKNLFNDFLWIYHILLEEWYIG